MMKILVTGASGFIGRNIVEQLGGRYTILAPLHSELELLDEVAVRDFLRRQAPVDAVIHAAVRPGHRNTQDPSQQLYMNTRMFVNLMRCQQYFTKFIFLSSGIVYDMRFYQPKMKEEYFDTHVPMDEGGLSKYVAAKFIQQAEGVVELRLFGVFGTYEDYAIRFISNAICKALYGLPITLKQNRRFDYLFIDDLIPVLEHFILQPPLHRAYNVTPDSAIELRVLAEQVRRVSGKDIPITVAQEGMGAEYSGDNQRLRHQMPQLRFTAIDQAIRQLYEWYAAHKAGINRELLLYDK